MDNLFSLCGRPNLDSREIPYRGGSDLVLFCEGRFRAMALRTSTCPGSDLESTYPNWSGDAFTHLDPWRDS